MSHDETNRTDRRTFLQAGAAATASAASLAPGARAQEAPAKTDAPGAVLPKRKLGKTGVEVTLLEQGAARGPSADRVLKFAFARGVRLFDTAKLYGTEINFKRWFEQDPAIRKQIVLVTKDMPRQPSDMLKMVDQRLATLGTDYIDFFFIHGLGDTGIDRAVKMIGSPEFRQVADKIRNSGKAKFIGFSAHHPQRAQLAPGGGRRRRDRRDHAPVPPLAGEGLAAEQGDRRGLEQGGRPDLHEADRQPAVRRQAQGEYPG